MQRVFYLVYLPLLHYFLLQLFVSSLYLVYFLLLFFHLYLLSKYPQILVQKTVFYLVYWLFLYSGYIYIEDSLYDIYIDYDFTFVTHYMSNTIVFSLSAIHLLILFLLGYNIRKLKLGR